MDNHQISHQDTFERKTRLVVILTAITMMLEVGYGYWTNSMALLADGYHMASHVFALGLSWFAYIIVRKVTYTQQYSFNKEKILALSGYTSAIVLFIVALVMAVESVRRLISPIEIRFSEAILVAVIGLIVNVLSAIFLHHDKKHSDHNIRAAYLHVIADGLTSITAIIALLAGMYLRLYSLDAFSGIVSSIVITRWAIGLMIRAGKDLADFKRNTESL